MKSFVTERLTLTPLRAGDASFLLALINTPSWIRFIGDRNVHSVKEARSYLMKGPVQHIQDHGYGMRKMTLTEEKTPIGICGLVRRDGLPHPDLGFALLPAYEGQGFAFEAARQVLTVDTLHWNLSTISAITTPENNRSIALLHRLGFKQDGEVQLPGEQDKLAYFRLDLRD
ncbi:MAG: GNAT family N-acetyltransferase [Saprospiraceae bacterium]|nr:GNAT family N-acetyltransferase [Saprospiraceae bacterium]